MHSKSLFLEERIVAIGSEMRSTSESPLGGGRNSGVCANRFILNVSSNILYICDVSDLLSQNAFRI